MPQMMEHLLACVNKGLVSEPVYPVLPETFPLRIAVSAAKLTSECAPPSGGLGHRVGIGVSDTADSAGMIALMEAVERYSLQHSSRMPRKYHPQVTLGGAAEPITYERLALGVPEAKYPVSTRGAASGFDLQSASRRASYECYEHHVREQLMTCGGGTSLIGVEKIDALKEIASYLEARLRRLTLRGVIDNRGLAFVACVCSDMNGGRPTTGYAAGDELDWVSVKAAREAILQWRNMIELERNCISLEPLSKNDLEIVEGYRGAARLPEWLDADGEPWALQGRIESHDDPLAALHVVTGQRVRLFDLSAPETGICTVRVVLG
jgi:hypothetical protein